ncbi:MAG: uroporphyrinogen decarboxylase family protein, partial [bacterium]
MPNRQYLPKSEVKKAIEYNDPQRVPMMVHQWCNPEAFVEEKQNKVKELLAKYPYDFYAFGCQMPAMAPDPENPEIDDQYTWVNRKVAPEENTGLDSANYISDWNQIEEILENFPRADHPGIFNDLEQHMKNAGDKYTIFSYGYCFFERIWSLRGMQNIMLDFYDHPDEVGAFFNALADFYVGLINRAAELGEIDGIFVTDDIGMQTGTMFNYNIFEKFFKPCYEKIFSAAHSNGLHFWLHTCGDVTKFMDDLIEIGLDVIHP